MTTNTYTIEDLATAVAKAAADKLAALPAGELWDRFVGDQSPREWLTLEAGAHDRAVELRSLMTEYLEAFLEENNETLEPETLDRVVEKLAAHVEAAR